MACGCKFYASRMWKTKMRTANLHNDYCINKRPSLIKNSIAFHPRWLEITTNVANLRANSACHRRRTYSRCEAKASSRLPSCNATRQWVISVISIKHQSAGSTMTLRLQYISLFTPGKDKSTVEDNRSAVHRTDQRNASLDLAIVRQGVGGGLGKNPNYLEEFPTWLNREWHLIATHLVQHCLSLHYFCHM